MDPICDLFIQIGKISKLGPTFPRKTFWVKSNVKDKPYGLSIYILLKNVNLFFIIMKIKTVYFLNIVSTNSINNL